ncbi:hypothetical protein ACFL2Q_02165 [Thermodesulfobacteriota bacterium]
MISLDDFEIDVECPGCGFYNPLRIKQIALEEPVICRGCKNLIRPVDHMDEVKTARKKINRAFRELEETLKNFGR